jgi:hypothetical protein
MILCNDMNIFILLHNKRGDMTKLLLVPVTVPMPLTVPIRAWGHFLDDADWSINGYTQLCDLKTKNDMDIFTKTLPHVTEAMFFAMVNEVQPLWEDKRNKGFWSYKIHKKFSNRVWAQLLGKLHDGKVMKGASDNQCINGITISPKQNFCIFKLYVNKIIKISDKNATAIENVDWASGIYKDF